MKTAIVLLGHGSRNQAAHFEFEALADMVRGLRPDCRIFSAYLQLHAPEWLPTVAEVYAAGFRHLIMIPVFLFAGNHIQQDIPELLKEARAKFPELTIETGDHLGPNRLIAAALSDRIDAALRRAGYHANPREITAESFEHIETLLGSVHYSPAERAVIRRVVHTTADPEIGRLVEFHPATTTAGIEALRAGVPIIADVRMVQAGIGRKAERFGCAVECSIDDPEISAAAEASGRTRAITAIRSLCHGLERGIVVIGNAPTALFELCAMIGEGVCRPDLVIGTPVGFVGAAESKQLLSQSGAPYIRTIGPRGGSTVAAAILNALCALAEEQR
jgi:precorrin-8X/cobalt-precorrin-8 methylmutase